MQTQKHSIATADDYILGFANAKVQQLYQSWQDDIDDLRTQKKDVRKVQKMKKDHEDAERILKEMRTKE